MFITAVGMLLISIFDRGTMPGSVVATAIRRDMLIQPIVHDVINNIGECKKGITAPSSNDDNNDNDYDYVVMSNLCKRSMSILLATMK